MPKTFDFRDYEQTGSKLKLTLDWKDGKLNYLFRIERKGGQFPDDIESNMLSPRFAGMELTWTVDLLACKADPTADAQPEVATLLLRAFNRIADDRGGTLAFEAAGQLDCPRDITADIQDWSTSGIAFVMGSSGRDSLVLSRTIHSPT